MDKSGAKKRNLSKNIPVSIRVEVTKTIYGFFFARRDRRMLKGIKKSISKVKYDSSRKGENNTLLTIKIVSSGIFPYQIVRYWA